MPVKRRDKVIAPPHPHDAFFKEVFSQTAHARELIARYAPPEVAAVLNLETLERFNVSFVDEMLKQHFTDLTFSVNLKDNRNRNIKGYICLIFEHKSNPDKWVALQLLRYIIHAWDHLRKQGAKKLPVVFPMVVYHGKQKWRVSHDLNALIDLQGLSVLARYVPSFEYHLFDLNQLDHASLSGAGLVNASLGAMKHIFDDKILSFIEPILQRLQAMPSDERRAYVKIVLRYIVRSAEKLDKAEFDAVVERNILAAATKEDVMTLATQWMLEGRQLGLLEGKQVGLLEGEKRGLLEGEKRGKQIGLLAGRIDMTTRMLRRKFATVPNDLVQHIQHLNADQLAEFGEALFDFDSVEDVKRWLAAHSA